MHKVFTVEFEPLWPVPYGCVIVALNKKLAFEEAKKTITHAEITIDDVKEIDIHKDVTVVFYDPGNY